MFLIVRAVRPAAEFWTKIKLGQRHFVIKQIHILTNTCCNISKYIWYSKKYSFILDKQILKFEQDLQFVIEQILLLRQESPSVAHQRGPLQCSRPRLNSSQWWFYSYTMVWCCVVFYGILWYCVVWGQWWFYSYSRHTLIITHHRWS